MQCKHPVVFCSLCAVCGCDLSDLETANISISHDARLQVSAVEASEIERGQKRGLLASRKLALLLDLDQTVVRTFTLTKMPPLTAQLKRHCWKSAISIARKCPTGTTFTRLFSLKTRVHSPTTLNCGQERANSWNR